MVGARESWAVFGECWITELPDKVGSSADAVNTDTVALRIHGQCVLYAWTVCTAYMDSVYCMHGQCVLHTWTVCTVCMIEGPKGSRNDTYVHDTIPPSTDLYKVVHKLLQSIELGVLVQSTELSL